MMTTNEYVEVRNGGYYVAGTRIGLDVVTYDFRNGRSPEAIFDAYPSIGSLAKVYGAITFILEHTKEIEAYLEDQDRRYEEITGEKELVLQQRGVQTMVATFNGQPLQSEFQGNLPEVCPVGALTHVKYRFTARPWDLQRTKSGGETVLHVRQSTHR